MKLIISIVVLIGVLVGFLLGGAVIGVTTPSRDSPIIITREKVIYINQTDLESCKDLIREVNQFERELYDKNGWFNDS